MACTLHVAWDERLTSYNFGPAHPLAPVRVELTVGPARALGVLDADGVPVAAPPPATDPELEYVHDKAYIEAVKQAGSGGASVNPGRYGLGTPDDPIFPGMHEASALVAGATLAAAAPGWVSTAGDRGDIARGLHPAMRGQASRVFNYYDPAISINWPL